ncbi:MipA/OmpV family protein [Pseudomonas viridiflava]|uniref:MipA/OmpV family protein n=1 Tax=Pseudomonas viridiflava TaxID=33069 RepID=UPI000C07EEC7|nr:MipA/OmpV family protein [Pseudomonas viridiflava]PHN61828.1 structural protein MipA [Pseudomonas viridiflava]
MTLTLSPKWTSIFFASAALLACGTGHADEPAPSTNQSIFGDRTSFTLGLGAAVLPRYMGSDKYRSQVLPVVSIQRGIFFADSTHGLGVQLQTQSGFSASAALNYDFGRSEKNSNGRPGSTDLKGMGTIGGSTVADLNVGQQILPWLSVGAEAELRLAGEQRGNRYRLGVEGIAYHSDRDSVTVDLDAHAGDSRYNQTYFGVTRLQSQLSGLTSFNSDSGIYAYSAALNWQHTFDAHWSTLASLGVTHYTDQTRGSPLVKTDAEGTGVLALNYTF